jgi:hypothetical protein
MSEKATCKNCLLKSALPVDSELKFERQPDRVRADLMAEVLYNVDLRTVQLWLAAGRVAARRPTCAANRKADSAADAVILDDHWRLVERGQNGKRIDKIPL